jgi:hypothetical protein
VEIWARERNERRAGRKAKIKVLISNNDFADWRREAYL